jgi:hypothetical protein
MLAVDISPGDGDVLFIGISLGDSDICVAISLGVVFSITINVSVAGEGSADKGLNGFGES